MDKSSIIQVVKGILISIITSMICVMIFAFILRQFYLSKSCIKPINIIIKILSIFLGCLLSIKENKGFLKGAIIGTLATILLHFIFYIITQNLAFNLSFLINVLLGLVMGTICGIISTNLKK